MQTLLRWLAVIAIAAMATVSLGNGPNPSVATAPARHSLEVSGPNIPGQNVQYTLREGQAGDAKFITISAANILGKHMLYTYDGRALTSRELPGPPPGGPVLVGTLAPKTQGLVQESSVCLNIDTSKVYANHCWRWYKLKGGEEDPEWAYRVVWESGGSKSVSDHAKITRHRDKVTLNEGFYNCPKYGDCYFDDWEPAGTRYTDNGETVTASMSIAVGGVGASMSETFVVYRDKWGPENFDDHVFSWDWWNLGNGIARGTTVESAGGAQYKWRTGTTRPYEKPYLTVWYIDV